MNKIKNMVNAAMMKANIDRFSFAQMTSNSDGKTSGSGTMGILTVGIGLITFLMGAIDFLATSRTDVMSQSLVVIGVGVGLLGYRKSKSSGKDMIVEIEVDEKIDAGDGTLNS